MFHDPYINISQRSGWIEVITGSMFSGKTEELIRRLRRAVLANQKAITFKSSVDKRFSETQIVSHDKNSIDSVVVNDSEELIGLSKDYDVIGIDEGQFFDELLAERCNILANKGKRVIVAGLDMDYTGKPFGPMPALLAMAESVTKVHAICVKCGNLAQYSHRKSKEKTRIVTGSMKEYEPLCRNCYSKIS